MYDHSFRTIHVHVGGRYGNAFRFVLNLTKTRISFDGKREVLETTCTMD